VEVQINDLGRSELREDKHNSKQVGTRISTTARNPIIRALTMEAGRSVDSGASDRPVTLLEDLV
jgi:hypothetical protein